MSKSSGKLVTISEALAKYSPDALRLWVLNSHYRSPITYSDEVIDSTEKGMERLRRAAHVDIEKTAGTSIDVQHYREQFIEAMDDDFGTPQALAVLFDLAREINRGHDEGLGIAEAHKTLLGLAEMLGLNLLSEPRTPEISIKPLISLLAKYGLATKGTTDVDRIISLLSEKRVELRRAKEWHLADGIRRDLNELNISLEDTPQGTVWRYSKP